MFFWEPIRPDILALCIPVILVILQPYTGITAEEALAGFANKATITILAMFVISEGIQRSGLVHVMGEKIAEITGDNEGKQVAFISTISGFVAGVLNNTPVVAIFIPVVTRLARKTNISPSKLLIPLSYSAMMGGLLTLIGSSSNILASDISGRLIQRSFSMFEFTGLGIFILLTGIFYLYIFGRHLVPARIDPEETLIDEYRMANYLTEVIIEEESPLIGHSVEETMKNTDLDMELVQIIRNGEQFMKPLDAKSLRPGDHLIIRADQKTLFRLMRQKELKLLPNTRVTRTHLEQPVKGQKLIEVVIPHGSFLQGQTLAEINFLERYDASLLAIRRGKELTHIKMDELTLESGDVLLLLVTERTLERFYHNHNFIVYKELETFQGNKKSMIKAGAVLFGVIVVAFLEILPIVISALSGVITMVLIGCVKPEEIYDSINWKVIFLLAGLIPLGQAMEKSGLAEYIARQIIFLSQFLSPFFMIMFFYLLTAVLTNIISKNASIVLMIPVAVDTASKLNLNPFSFIIAVTFAASTAFLTPLGNQTNLMIYGPGGYKFSDYFRTGAPLQLIFAVLTTIGISIIWGI
ncbi:MAG: SLC13 family permease [Halanaerobiaceae bacterium]